MTRKIRKAAVIGSGVMGSGIAALLASAGAKTLLLDIVPLDLSEDEKKDAAARNRCSLRRKEASTAWCLAIIFSDSFSFASKSLCFSLVAIGNISRRFGTDIVEWLIS